MKNFSTHKCVFLSFFLHGMDDLDGNGGFEWKNVKDFARDMIRFHHKDHRIETKHNGKRYYFRRTNVTSV